MEIKKRLSKIEEKIGKATKSHSPIMIEALSEESAERKISELKKIYGEAYMRPIVLIIPEGRWENAMKRGIT